MTNNKFKRNKKKILLSLGFILAGAGITLLIFLTEPTAEKAGATRETAMLVDIIEAEKGAFRPTIVATGTVEPARDIILSSRVGGKIIRVTSSFVPGQLVEKGKVLLQIDPSDYKNDLQLQKSELQQAESDLLLEQGRQDVARQDYKLLDQTLTNQDESLVLRQPQLDAAKARLKAAQAAVDQASLNLERTTIRAPFDARVLDRAVNLGSQVDPGDNLGRLVGVKNYWIRVSLPLEDLNWLSFPGDSLNQGSPVMIRDRTAWPENVYREGYLFSMVGTLEDQTRLASLLVNVPDPVVKEENQPLLVIGAFVETSIQGEMLQDVVRINRDYIRDNASVWLFEEGRLAIKEVEILYQDQQFAYISEGVYPEDQIITTNLATVTEGAPLRLKTGEEQAGQNQALSNRKEVTDE
ncbi:MAG: efflux RND transporter periplasmic adaptor subunit [Candidatus Cyclobacteriaceae bacterium M3_2C_046]